MIIPQNSQILFFYRLINLVFAYIIWQKGIKYSCLSLKLSAIILGAIEIYLLWNQIYAQKKLQVFRFLAIVLLVPFLFLKGLQYEDNFLQSLAFLFLFTDGALYLQNR